jgi:lysophospholipase L1-like esterase
VLSVPGVKAILLLEGINDIGRGFSPAGPTEPVTFEALKAADEQIIARAHERGIRVIGATLTPYKGDPKRTLVQYQLHIDPKVHLPDSLISSGQRKSLPDLFARLREQTVAKPQP